MYKYKINGWFFEASDMVDALRQFHKLYGDEEVRSVVRMGGNNPMLALPVFARK